MLKLSDLGPFEVGTILEMENCYMDIQVDIGYQKDKEITWF